MKSDKNIEKEQDKELMTSLNVNKDELKALKKKLAKVAPRSERGVETLFRLASKNHYTLNTMVDRKSSILISINGIILSIIIGTVMNQLDQDPHLIVPVIMILVTNLISIVYAVFATRPAIKHGKFSTSHNAEKSNNLLFYGNYMDKSEEEYVSGMNGLIDNGEELYNSISRDIYYTGKSINRKFKYLRLSFNIFMIGIVLSVGAFIACHVFFGELI